MRPLSLTISGLHSFRDERTIDFTRLVQDRLFGIFGPTGSGKSTILDAMTLALFGQIERTSGSRVQSAITSGMEDCRVSFTFDLLVDGMRRRFTAERVYKVRKSGMRSEVRFMEHDPENPDDLERVIVLADKSKEMDEHIDRLLAISHDDFSRAVILPQGAFSRFLSMGNADRGTMLKRIFGLEELSNRMHGRLKEKYATLKSAQENREGRLIELQKFNDEELAARQEAFESAEKEAALRTTEHEKAEKAHTEAVQLIEQVSRLSELKAGSEERVRQRKKIEALELSLKRAADAAEVEGSVIRHQEAAVRESEAKKAVEEARIAQQKAEEAIAPLVPQQKEMEDRQGENGIIRRLDREIETLSGLVEVDRGIGEIVGEIETKSEEIAAAKSRLAQTSEKIAALGKERAGLEEKKSAQEKEDQSEKEKLKELERKRETIKDLLNASENLQEASKRVTAKSKEAKESDDRVATLTKESERLTEEADALRTTLDERRAELERRRRDNTLASLLPHLVEGEPCPLCGSGEHPHPHEAGDAEETGRLEEEIASVQKRLDTATTTAATARETMKQAEAQRDERRRTHESLLADRTETQEKLTSLLTAGKYDGATDPETLRGFLGTCEARITTIEETQSRAAATVETMKAKLEELATAITSAEQSEAILKQQVKTTTDLIEKQTARLKERREERSVRLKERDLNSAAVPEGKAALLVKEKTEERDALKREVERIERAYAEAMEKKREAVTLYDAAFRAHLKEEQSRTEALRDMEKRLAAYDFASIEEWNASTLPREERDRLSAEIKSDQERIRTEETELSRLSEALGDRTITTEVVEKLLEKRKDAEEAYRAALKQSGDAERALKDCRVGNEELKKLQSESAEEAKEYEVVKTLRGYLAGNAFIDFIANDRLRHICRTASKELGRLTNGRLHIDAESGTGFYIIDHAAGGVERPTASLSGGETFLVSLALALALSESLQMRGAPLEFFFLDEGFGTLDAELLTTVMDALDRIRTESNRTIGIISHVRELHERIPRRLIVSPATETEGTDVSVEIG